MLVLYEILRLFVNTLTGDDKNSLLNRDNLTEPNQILVSQIQKTFSHFLFSFLECALSFEYFQKKDDFISRCISKITLSQKDN